jgi:tRNA A-37 threonylcarbamoyl transferase component Bud32
MPFTLSDYTDIQELAKGGMGKIYLATQVSLNRKVVIKEMAAGLLTTKNEIKRFENEAQAGAALNHDNIIRIYDFGEEKNSFYIAMEFIDGPDLDALLKEDDFPKEIGMIILQQALKGLTFAHEQGIVHRDVKPANILLSRNGAVKMADFGLAYAGTRSSQMTATGAIVGTPVYMSPELVNGEETRDRCMDIWAAGVILYRLVTGRFPFPGETVPSTLISIIQDKEKPAGEIDRTLPPNMAALLDSCLEKDHTKRLASLAPLIEALQNYFFEIGIRDPVDTIKKYLANRSAALAEFGSLLARYHLAKGNECSRDMKHSAALAHYQAARKHDPKNKELVAALRSHQDYMGALTAETATVGGGMLSQVRAVRPKKKSRGLGLLATAAVLFSFIILGAAAVVVLNRDAWNTVKKPLAAVVSRVVKFVQQPASVLSGAVPVTAPEGQKPESLMVRTGTPAVIAKGESEAAVPKADAVSAAVAPVPVQSAKDSNASAPSGVSSQPQVQPPALASGLVKVEVNPPAALVKVDNRVITTQEMGGTMLNAGTHFVTATADGFAPSTASVTVSGNDTHLVMIGLTPEKRTGELEVLSDIAAEIYIDGEFRGNAPTTAPIVLTEGQHTVVFKRAGVTPYVKSVSILAGETRRVKVEPATKATGK